MTARERGDGRSVVAVVGAYGPLGTAVATRLAAAVPPPRSGRKARAGADASPLPPVSAVVAIDHRRSSASAIPLRAADPWDPALADLLSDVSAVVIAALDPDLAQEQPIVGERATSLVDSVLDACVRAEVPQVVLLSSAMVLGASPGAAVPLPDDAPLQDHPAAGIVADLVQAERLLERSSLPVTTALRPAVVVGDPVDTALTRHFEAPRLLCFKDAAPLWQFTHVDDLASAVLHVIAHRTAGAVPVACHGWLTQSEVEERTGLRGLELPGSFIVSTAESLHRIGVSPAPAAELDYLRYPWVVSSRRLSDEGWTPEWTNVQVLEQLMVRARDRTAIGAVRLGRPDATSITAASAAAAVLGAAALVRARRRRSG